MKIKVRSKPPAAPEETFSITGLTRDEMEFLRDLTGRFADSPGDGGIARHFHTGLYGGICAALGHGLTHPKSYEFSARTVDNQVILHCRRAGYRE